jgi:acetyltransferase-like isoleucine patch superfamily enzyme
LRIRSDRLIAACVLTRSLAAEVLAVPYRLRLRRVGRRPRLFPFILISGGRRIALGDDARAESFVTLSVGRGGRITIGDHCELRRFAQLEADTGYIEIGHRCSVNQFCVLNGYGGIRIGNDVRIAAHSVILSSTHNHDNPRETIHSQGMSGLETVVGDDVWIGTHSVILGGVRIGSHVIIGAGAVVNQDVPDYAVAAGVPARVIRMRLESET